MCLVARADKVLVDSLMDQLEDVIAHREVFLAAKEKRLEDLYAALKSEKDERKRFYLLTDLYVEYHPLIPIPPIMSVCVRKLWQRESEILFLSQMQG